ncbi:MAG: iron-sulfur cluster assembly scaffold protein [Sphingomonadales bacterium]|jgi:NifU-like protein involved in Fe-S cluster formation|nr:iron-sulfur cluster assembly scaffold protein [Sphingomonadales bacterium]
MSATLYTPEILRLSVETASLPRLPAPHASAERRAPVCGSRVIVDVALADGAISAIGLEVRACAMGQASSALLAKGAPGRTAADLTRAAAALRAWLSDAQETAPDWPGIAALAPARAYPARHGAILIPFEAAAAAAAEAQQAQTVT